MFLRARGTGINYASTSSDGLTSAFYLRGLHVNGAGGWACWGEGVVRPVVGSRLPRFGIRTFRGKDFGAMSRRSMGNG